MVSSAAAFITFIILEHNDNVAKDNAREVIGNMKNTLTYRLSEAKYGSIPADIAPTVQYVAMNKICRGIKCGVNFPCAKSINL